VSSGPLDRPAWHALHGPQAALTTGEGAVRRLDPRYGPFACAPDAGPESLAALGALLRGPNDAIAVFEPEAWPAPPGTRVAVTVDCVQMICVDMPVPSVTATALLGEDDALAMRALAAAAEPGPWSEWTHRYGDYFGVRQGAGLLAMAGERLRPAPGLTEVSGWGWASKSCARSCTTWQRGATPRSCIAGPTMQARSGFMNGWASRSGGGWWSRFS
jgi:hypothetical protein